MRIAECEGDTDKKAFPVAPEKLRGPSKRPTTAIQAVMECRPGDEPELSQEELLPLREVLADALDGLSARERWVVERHAIEGLSFAAIGKQLSLSKSMSHKIFQRAQQQLRNELQENHLVKGHLA